MRVSLPQGEGVPPHNFTPVCLIATLGSEPQVVTAALDLLSRQGDQVNRVVVVHTTAGSPAVAQAVERLRQAFSQHPYSPHLAVEFVCAGIPDVDTPERARAYLRALYHSVLEAKKRNERLHILIAGGRKTMAIYGMLVAQLLFDEHDHLWHLFSSGDFLSSKRLHPEPGDETHLAEIPVIRWSQVTPAYTVLQDEVDPLAAVERIATLQLNQKVETGRAFMLGSLTPAEARATRLLVMEGLSDAEIASRLNLSARTVEQQLRAAYRKAADHWELPDVSRALLVALLGLYCATLVKGNNDGKRIKNDGNPSP